MDRKPSTTIRRPNGCTPLPKSDGDKALFRGIFVAAREAFNKPIQGLTGVRDGRAYFQIVGDSTPYSIALTLEEINLFHLLEGDTHAQHARH